MRGMTLAHEGYDGYNGYGGSMMKASLDSLAELHVNALAIVPYTWMRNPHVPTPYPISDRPGTETDEAVVATIEAAHQRGWAVLLKPQIWLNHEHWPGDISFDTEENWTSFFGHYRTWILHYAQLAAANEVAALCIGTELVQTTLTHPDEWRALIADIRAIYGGTLTYAANWGEEFERISFWQELDVIGLNGYYPLYEAAPAAPTDAELRAGVQRWMGKAEAISRSANRPLWLTEVGYRPVENAWLNPHAAAKGRAYEPLAQQRCYAALAAVAQTSPRLTGIFVWKWPSYLGYHGPHGGDRTGFTPLGSPAARVLADFYANW